MKTGKEIWKQKFADFKEGYTGIIAPLIANGVADHRHGGRRPHHARLPRRLGSGHREAVVAPLHHPRARRARLGNLAQGHAGRLEIRRRRNLAERRPTIPSSICVYWGTGNAEPYNPDYRGGADSLYTASVIAIRPKTGELVWHYQYIPNESYDFDGYRRASACRSARSTDKCAKCC